MDRREKAYKRSMLRGRILKLTPEASWVFTEQAGVTIAAFVGIKLLTHVLEPSEFGRLALANTIVMLIGTSFFGPLGQGLLRFWAISRERGELHTFYCVCNRFATYVSTVSLLLAVVLSCTVSIAKGFDWMILVILSSGIGIITGLFGLKVSVFMAARQRRRTALLRVGNVFLRPLCAVLLIVLTVPLANMALVGYLVAIVIVFVIARGLYNQEVSKTCDSDSRFDIRLPSLHGLRKEIWNYTWPFLVWAGFGWIHLSCDRWSLQTFHGANVVGAFAVVSSLSTYPLVFGSGFLTKLFTPIAFQKAGDVSRSQSVSSANKILLLTLGIYVMGAAIIIVVFSLFHQSLIILISNERFAMYSYLLPWLTLAWTLFYLGQLLISLGLVAKQTRSYILPKLVCSVVAFLGTFSLSANMGPVGIVLGLGIAGAIYAVWCGMIALKLLRAPRKSP